MSHLLFDPHHDGSPLYVPDEAPALGSTVTLRCRTSTTTPVTDVWVRSAPAAEPHFDRAVEESRSEHEVWWRAELLVRNPVQRYRFMVALDGDDSSSAATSTASPTTSTTSSRSAPTSCT
jgi:alpha-glucosidase